MSGQPPDSHMTAFRPINEAARSWSDDNASWQLFTANKHIYECEMIFHYRTNIYVSGIDKESGDGWKKRWQADG